MSSNQGDNQQRAAEQREEVAPLDATNTSSSDEAASPDAVTLDARHEHNRIRSTRYEWLNSLANEYGMIIVLGLLGGLFTLLTIDRQNPMGREAGREVADRILRQQSPGSRVLVVAGEGSNDRQFVQAAAARLREGGAQVMGEINGKPIDARRAVEAIVADQQTIEVIATDAATGKWTVWDRLPATQELPRLQPQPYYWPNFLKISNVIGVANQTAIYAIIAIGMTLVILTAGIDLSVGSLVALSAVAASLVMRRFGGTDATLAVMVGGVFAGLAIATAAGAINGILITIGKLPPFIVTLGMMMMASGLAFRLSSGRSIPELPESFFWLGGGKTAGVPHPVFLMIGLYAIAYLVTTWMVFGRFVYAIGGNQEAARLSGVPIKRTLLIVYSVSGGLAGLGGVLLASQLQAGDPKFGLMYELEVIAAVVVGGTSLMGGRGKVVGTLIGAFIIAVIKNGMNLTSVDPFNQKIVLGAVLLGAVMIDRLKRRQSNHG